MFLSCYLHWVTVTGVWEFKLFDTAGSPDIGKSGMTGCQSLAAWADHGEHGDIPNIELMCSLMFLDQWEISRILKWRYVNVPYKGICSRDIP